MMGEIKVALNESQLLDGSKILLINRIGDGSIIKRFDKTPLPVQNTSVVCPHFLELKWAYGCPFDCAWCYLKGTFRFLPTGTKPVVKNYDKIESHLRRFLSELTVPEILNTGEIADSLMSEGSTQPFSKFVIPIFEMQNRHKVLFVTKSNNIRHLLEISPHNQVIVSFSLNSDDVAKRWERGAPPIDRRIEAARELTEAIAAHATEVGSERVERTRKLSLEEKAMLAARAYIRHNYTPYEDQLLEFGFDLEPGDFLYREVKSEAQEAVDEFLSHPREGS
jgi:hypothetical protein